MPLVYWAILALAVTTAHPEECAIDGLNRALPGGMVMLLTLPWDLILGAVVDHLPRSIGLPLGDLVDNNASLTFTLMGGVNNLDGGVPRNSESDRGVKSKAGTTDGRACITMSERLEAGPAGGSGLAKDDSESRAGARFTLDGDFGAMGVGDGLRDRESQTHAGAAAASAVGAIEAFENMGQCAGRDALAGVLHG